MSNDNFYSEDNDQYSEEFSSQPQQGMSKGVKILLILLGAGGICMLLCCGGLYWGATQLDFKFKVTEKKEEIIELQNEIADITIPDTFIPQAGLTVGAMGKVMEMAIFITESQQGTLILMGLNIPDDGMLDLEKEFRQGLQDQKQNESIRDLNITKEEPREFTIKDKKFNFTFAEGTDRDSNQKFNQVTGVFPGKKGPAFLMLQIESDKYNEEEIVKMIESIK